MLQKNPNNLSQYEEVKAFVHAQFLALQETEVLPLQDLVGRVLAEDVASPLSLPSWPQSAMDGYAFSSQANNDFLPVVGCLYAGESPKQIPANAAVRIMTGALLPEGLDTVVPFEEAMVQSDSNADTESAEKLLKPAHLALGRHVKPVGSDVKLGQVLLAKGHKLSTRDIGLIASVGIHQVKVVRKVRVAILASGDELLVPGEAYSLGKTYDANSYQIAALCASLPVEVVACERLPDDVESVSKSLNDWSQQVDVVLTLGGASAGQKDFIKTVMASYDESWFWKLSMKPAKPFAMARQEKAAWILALPGNPLAAFMSFQLFAFEALLKLSGQTSWQRKSVNQILLSEMPANSDKARWIQVLKTEQGVLPMPNVSASQLSVLSGASGFIRLLPNVDYHQDALVEYWEYDCAK
ncbi:molybdopterin molybdotransferase MoeA [Hydrogenovibrio marinus]|uniref:Molybdopterin molybdenumtransferase n=1 Tax=Hydrogenovibrio marinus TaxID=28885 RepID=A0A066ZT42_HYDMR|nr:molybdopterin molybdotransferase MoeA [Hydrogenovibrio marinus]KDN95454.1 hypothetical protein EI16_03900 [Hydrogenovibrio marinus]BBN59944.1 molybdopterin molybdenumtransferase MoeA [Hydrogenovibrio marinus]